MAMTPQPSPGTAAAPTRGCRGCAARGDPAATEVELVMSLGRSGGSDGQAGLSEAAVYEVAAVLDVA